MCLMAYANSKGADQPAHLRSLISTFVVCCLDSMICILAIRLPAKNDPAPPPLGNFADIVYLKEQSFLHRIRDVCTL